MEDGRRKMEEAEGCVENAAYKKRKEDGRWKKEGWKKKEGRRKKEEREKKIR